MANENPPPEDGQSAEPYLNFLTKARSAPVVPVQKPNGEIISLSKRIQDFCNRTLLVNRQKAAESTVEDSPETEAMEVNAEEVSAEE